MKNRKIWSPFIFLGIFSFVGVAGIGIYYGLKAFSKSETDVQTNSSIINKNEKLDDIIFIRANRKGSGLLASEVAKADSIREFVNFYPYVFNVFNYDLSNINQNLKLGYKIIPNSIDDRRGIFKINISLLKISKTNPQKQDVIEQKVFTVSGFKTTISSVLSRNDNILFKNRTSRVLNSIQELKLQENKKNVDISLINTKNFWDYFEIPEGFKVKEEIKLIPKKVENSINNFDLERDKNVKVIDQIQEKHEIVVLKENESYVLSVLDILGFNKNNKSFQVELGLTHREFKDNTVAKFLTVQNNDFNFTNKLVDTDPINNENISIKLKSKYSNFLPSFFFTNRILTTEDFNLYFDIQNFANIDQYQIEIAPELNNDQDGTFALYIKKKEANSDNSSDKQAQNLQPEKLEDKQLSKENTQQTNKEKTSRRLIYVQGFNSYDQISKNIVNDAKINIDNINNYFNLEDERLRKTALANLNNEVASVSWDFVGKQLKNLFEGKSENLKLFENTENLFGFSKSNYYFARTYDFKIEDNKLKFVFVNALNEQFNLYIEFTQKPKATSIYTDTDGESKSTDELFSDIHKRTMAIQYFVKNTDENNKSVVKGISGTAWVFDRELDQNGKPTGVYYLATNIHVVEEFLKNPSNVYSFAYSLSNKEDKLDFSQQNDFSFDEPKSDFRQISKITYDEYGYPLSPENYQVNNRETAEFWENFRVIPLGLNSTKNNKFQDIALIRIKFPKDKVIKRGFSLDDFFEINRSETKIQNVPDAVNYYNEHPLKFFISNKFTWPTDELNKEISLPIQLYLGGYLSGDNWVEASQNAVLDSKNNFKKSFKYKGKTYTASPSISLPNIYSGHGMSGSLVLNQQGQAVGIFWGGIFPDDKPKSLTRGIGQLDTFGIKIDSNETVLSKWLDQSKDINTELDKYEKQIDQIKQ